MLAAPAELGLDSDVAGTPTPAGACAVATAGVVPFPVAPDGEGVVVLLGVAVAFVVTPGFGFAVFAAAMLTAIEAGGLPLGEGAGLGAAAVWTVTAGDDGLPPGFTLPGVPAAFCAFGTVPAPGVPWPGKTVPCCKLPSFG